ncbi:MAG: DNA-processing protein DprA [Patescibacteria group bacterium]
MKERIFYNAVNVAENGSYSKISSLLVKFGSWENAWRKSGAHDGKITNPEIEWKKIESQGIKLILDSDAEYPPLLKEIPNRPLGIYILGNLPPKSKNCVAVVGTRKATNEGKRVAKDFSAVLSKSDIVVVSGLALGIDAAAHEGCLEENGETIAVLGGGLCNIYPRTNEKLAERILRQNGAIISEYPADSPSLPHQFLQRNRIISGLSRGVLLVEAPQNSGSLATARFALDQNREIFVVPGPISHPNFIGSNQLIRSGATLVTKPEEILEDLGVETEQKENPRAYLKTAGEKAVFDALLSHSEPVGVDKISEITNLNILEVNRILTFLIIGGMIEETGGNYSLK